MGCSSTACPVSIACCWRGESRELKALAHGRRWLLAEAGDMKHERVPLQSSKNMTCIWTVEDSGQGARNHSSETAVTIHAARLRRCRPVQSRRPEWFACSCVVAPAPAHHHRRDPSISTAQHRRIAERIEITSQELVSVAVSAASRSECIVFPCPAPVVLGLVLLQPPASCTSVTDCCGPALFSLLCPRAAVAHQRPMA